MMIKTKRINMQVYRDLSERVPAVEAAEEEEEVVVEEIKDIQEDCIKCGWDEADYLYTGESITIYKTIGGATRYTNPQDDKCADIILTCRRCGFQWVVKSLDTLNAVDTVGCIHEEH